MENAKTALSVAAIMLTIGGYIPYIRDTLKGTTKPHVFTWFLWGFQTVITYGLQINAGAGVGSWTTLAVAISCFLIFALGMRNGKKDITKSDVIFFALSLIGLAIWLAAKQPILSTILLSSTAIIGFIPTIRKSWNNPHSETLLTYRINVLRHGLSFLALQQYNIVTWLYPVVWMTINGLFSIMLTLRRNHIDK